MSYQTFRSDSTGSASRGYDRAVPYAFAATPAELIDDQLSCIQSCYDPTTTATLDSVGVGAGWRCWEVGLGAGSMAAWLADRVGPTGSVLATDVNLDRAPRRDNLEVRRHDITQDDPPDARFDVIHARLVLQHLPERYKVISRLVDCLRPGGWLVLEEFDCGYLPVLAGDEDDAGRYDRVLSAMLGILTGAGVDILWGSRIFAALRGAGLVDVSAVNVATASPGGTPGARLFAINAHQLRDQLRAAGVSADDIDRFQRLLHDPSFVVSAYPLTSCRGRRPHEGA